MRSRHLVGTSGAGVPGIPRRLVCCSAVLTILAVALAAPGFAEAKPASGKSISLHSGTLTLKFTHAAFAALTKSTSGSFANTRTLTPVAPGASASPGVFTFPLASGKVNLTKLTGKVASKGAINFVHVSTLPLLGTSTTQFVLKSFALHLGGSGPVLSATFVGGSTTPNAPFATLVTTHAKHSKHGRVVSISGISLKLTSTGVQVFDEQNGGFKVGQVIGTASVSAKT